MIADQDDLHGLLRQLGIVDQGGKREEISPDLAAEGANDRFGSPVIRIIAAKDRQPGQHTDQCAVAGRHRGIGGGLRPRDQPWRVVGGEEIPATGRVPIVPVKHLYPLARVVKIGFF